MTLSVVLITFNEEENLPRTLKSVEGLVRDAGGEIIVVDSGSTDRTVEIAKSFGAKVFVEAWKGFAAQKNSAIDKASGEWVLLLDADEAVSDGLAAELTSLLRRGSTVAREWCGTVGKKIPPAGEHPEAAAAGDESPTPEFGCYAIPRKNMFLGRWVKRGGFWPDRKLRFFLRGYARAEDRLVHESLQPQGGNPSGKLHGCVIHHAYPTLSSYIEHMNRYSSLGAEMAGPRGFNLINIYIRPQLTFFYNYFLRLGFLDGREGLLLHLYHAVYVSWKYAKAWELSKVRMKTSE